MVSKYEKHVFICTNKRETNDKRGCCATKNSEAIQLKLKSELQKRGLGLKIRANKAGCFDFCENGPVLVVYPEGIWYQKVTPDDVEEIVENHLVGGIPVERLKMN
ncbi:(2Fe-2S) ferredoxin domain-containing protein [bacterium]|nr:(2Fe-2S) ferredoxin domain-containing protein [bacterium]